MSRHRNVKHMMDEYDDDEDLDEEEYYISMVLQKAGKKVGRKKAIQALEATNWVINDAVKLLKTPPPQAAPVEPQRKISEETKIPQTVNLDMDYPDVYPAE